MTETAHRYAGGCLCGAVRYAAEGEPLYAGLCYCADCRKASGSAFVGFMGFRATTLSFSGRTLEFGGGDALRNSCPVCGSLVFGGKVGADAEHTIYAGSLDAPFLFRPTIAIFARDCPPWAIIPPGLKIFETMPG